MNYIFFEVKNLKKKIILIALIGSILSVIIYFYTKSDEINIVSLGDGISIGMTPYNIEGYSYNDYLKEEYQSIHKLKKYYEFGGFGKTVKELIYEIKENKSKIINQEKIEIERAISDANILTISIGMDEISEDKITKERMEEYLNDMEELLSMIKILNHHKVIVLGIYTIKDEELMNTAKINAKIRDLAITNDFTFIDIQEILKNKDYYLDNKSYYINYLGHKAIYNEIKKYCKV